MKKIINLLEETINQQIGNCSNFLYYKLSVSVDIVVCNLFHCHYNMCERVENTKSSCNERDTYTEKLLKVLVHLGKSLYSILLIQTV